MAGQRTTPGASGTRGEEGTRGARPRDDDRRESAPGRRPRTRRVGGALAAALLCVTAATCGALTGPADGERGILRVERADPAASTDVGAGPAATAGPGDATEGSIEAPGQVRVGERFTATVTTVGLDGCWEPLDERVSVDGLDAVIVPFDTDGAEEGAVCTQALVFLDHPVELSFEEAGEAVVRVEGRRVVGIDGSESEPLALEATVTVVP